jgi:hypothetical protein
MSALITTNLSKDLTPAEFNHSNTCNLEAGHSHHPIV